MVNGVYVENQISKVKFVKNERNMWGVNFIEIKGFEDGQYVLWLKKESIRFTITVHKGDYWNKTYEFIIKETAMIERNRQRIDCLRIDAIKIDHAEVDDVDEKVGAAEAKKSVKRVTVHVGGDFNHGKTRIHAWAFKFFPYDL
jgi:hypothetical protein